MSDTPETIDLAYIGRTLQRIVVDVATLRDDMTVLAAIAHRIDNNQDRMIEELRAMHRQHDRVASRVRQIEDRIAS